MLQSSLRTAIADVGKALKEPEEFALAWRDGGERFDWRVWAALAATATLGATTYGMTMGILGGPARVLASGLLCTLAAGLAWAIPLPGIYVVNSLFGSKLRLPTTMLAALVTVSWGGMAMIASIPISWFFTVAIPVPGFVLLVNLVVFAGVGTSMIDIFGRVMRALEPGRGRQPTWLLVPVGAIGIELFHAFGLFQFGFTS